MDSKTLLQLLSICDKEPEDAKKEIKELFSSMEPVIFEVCNGLIHILDEISKDKRSAEIYARLLKNRFDALVDTGFTESQAIHILLSDKYNIGSFFINKNK